MSTLFASEIRLSRGEPRYSEPFRGFVHVRTAPGRNRAIEPEDDRARRRYMYDVCLVLR
jgi:hypothetical protein